MHRTFQLFPLTPLPQARKQTQGHRQLGEGRGHPGDAVWSHRGYKGGHKWSPWWRHWGTNQEAVWYLRLMVFRWYKFFLSIWFQHCLEHMGNKAGCESGKAVQAIYSGVSWQCCWRPELGCEKKNINSSNFQLTYISILVSPGTPLILGAAKSRRLSRLEGNLLASTHMAADWNQKVFWKKNG